MSVTYKTFEIKPTPMQLIETKEWSTSVMIIKHKDDSIVTRPFSAGNTFKIEPEAIEHSINFGKQIINGKYQDLSVSDM